MKIRARLIAFFLTLPILFLSCGKTDTPTVTTAITTADTAVLTSTVTTAAPEVTTSSEEITTTEAPAPAITPTRETNTLPEP